MNKLKKINLNLKKVKENLKTILARFYFSVLDKYFMF